MRKPPDIQRLRANVRHNWIVRPYEKLHVEVIGGANRTAEHLVPGQQERVRIEREIDKPALFVRLPKGGGFQGGVSALDVTTGL